MTFFLFHNLRSCNFYSFFSVPESSFLWLDAALWWSSQQLLSYSTVFIFCVRYIFVFFQKKEASKVGQELTAEFRLSSIKLYLTQHSEIAIIFYWTHCPWVSFFLSWKHQKTYLCASSFHFWQISQRAILWLIQEYWWWHCVHGVSTEIKHAVCCGLSALESFLCWSKQVERQPGRRVSPARRLSKAGSHEQHEDHRNFSVLGWTWWCALAQIWASATLAASGLSWSPGFLALCTWCSSNC